LKAQIPGRVADVGFAGSLAAKAFLHREDLINLLVELQNERLLTIAQQDHLRLKVRLNLTGWERADEIQRRRGGLTRAFVAMWFSDEVNDIYYRAIRPALVACGYKPPFRVDDPEYEDKWNDAPGDAKKDQKIDDRILAAIRRSRFVLVDMTGQRQSVYFEAGFAEGLGIPIIWTCREDDAKKGLAFDTRQNEHLLWTSPDQLRSELVARIGRRGWRLT
jgi:hypothetical protein